MKASREEFRAKYPNKSDTQSNVAHYVLQNKLSGKEQKTKLVRFTFLCLLRSVAELAVITA